MRPDASSVPAADTKDADHRPPSSASQEEVPALGQLKLVIRLELRAVHGHAPIWRVETPGPQVSKDPAGDARLDVSVQRPHFNELAAEGGCATGRRAYERGHVKVTGDSAVVKLLGNVIQRQLARSRA